MKRRPISECHQPWESMVVDPLGGVQACCFASRQVGNLKESTVDEIWNGPRMVRLRGAIRDGFVDPLCRNASCSFVRETERIHGFDSYDFRCEPNVSIPTTDLGRTGFFVSGWWTPEYWGVWSKDRDARLILDLPDRPVTDLTLEFSCRGAGHAHSPHMNVQVTVNGKELDCWDFAYPGATQNNVLRSVDVSAALLASRRLEIDFRIDNPVCPQSWGLDDGRRIGLALSAIKVVTGERKRGELGSHPKPDMSETGASLSGRPCARSSEAPARNAGPASSVLYGIEGGSPRT